MKTKQLQGFVLILLTWHFSHTINQGVIRLLEKGVLANLKKKWWEKERGGGMCKVKFLMI